MKTKILNTWFFEHRKSSCLKLEKVIYNIISAKVKIIGKTKTKLVWDAISNPAKDQQDRTSLIKGREKSKKK